MALQMGALRLALVEAGASEEKASKAAEEMAGYENRFAKIESDLTVMKWQLGMLIAGMLSLMGGVLSLMLKAFA